MNIYLLIIILTSISAISYAYGRKRAMGLVKGNISLLHSLPGHYGWFSALSGLLPGLIVIFLWMLITPPLLDNLVISRLGMMGAENIQNLSDFEISILLTDIHNLARGDAISRDITPGLIEITDYYTATKSAIAQAATVLAIGLTAIMALLSVRKVTPEFRSRNLLEKGIMYLLIASSAVAILTTAGIVFSLIIETLRFFDKVPVSEFLFSLKWSPQTALRADQVGSSGSFGAIPLLVGTLLITFIALVVATPVGLLSAVYMTKFASRRVRNFFKPLLEILAGIPTVVYGFFAALVVAPAIRDAGQFLQLEIASESALAAGIVMGVMIIPLISSLSDDVIAAVPQSLTDGSLGLGATRTETVIKVILPAALPGIVSAILLAASRAIGETMIVVMAAGMSANLTINPLEAVTTVTVQIMSLLTGDQEFDSAKTLAAFALGLALFTLTLGLNFIALKIVRKYSEQYD